jgi:DNA topoisomerase I
VELIQTLIICEKPDAAARVARALDEDGDPHRIESQGVPVYESTRREETIIVCSALGHLYAVDSKSRSSRRYFPVWDNGWRAKHLFEKKSARLARWIQALGSFAQDADRFVNACDYDVEGSLIGFTILQYACNNAQSRAFRMKFSAMTEEELRRAYRSLSPQLDFSIVEAGKCRHELDWLYGINLSRLLTQSNLRQNRGYSTLSTGRVQGPTLKFVVEREEEIQCFTPTPFWTIDAAIEHNGKVYSINYEKDRLQSIADANAVVQDCKDSLLAVKAIDSNKLQEESPHPFDLSSLQSEAYRHFGFTPGRTLSTAERLYLDGLISYPRTSSQILPPDIGYSNILQGLARNSRYRDLASKLTGQLPLHPNQGPKHDPAHPAIYPTGDQPSRRLLRDEENLLDLIIKRFMATFAEPSLQKITKTTLTSNQHNFFLRGSEIAQKGWIEFYRPYASFEAMRLPELNLDDRVLLEHIDADEKFTEPPPRFNPASLLRRMEKENIGTKATRAETIDTLYRRDYIKGTRMQPTSLALKIINILEKYSPMIIDPSFTARLENQMELVQSNETTRAQILAETAEHLRPIMLDLIGKEDQIGVQLAEVLTSQKIAAITFVVPCPTCGSELRIIRSRVSGKRFIGCTGYAKGCRFTLPLPQFGRLTLSPTKCKVCGFQQITVRNRFRGFRSSCPQCYAAKANDRTRAPKVSEPRRKSVTVSAST